eukprot:CAMPEP_0197301466 /NCGR_PEP_ID=MMETSP0890-20130614/50418_1 /TAXON_ID=44058 ORGANISM="Aureoumbra lagunensis, Strain CCMP1510" /NCGR_SAMPLE_ID=MMETSP0890 /ASSEMBLY_ACC=CAM_ASM_000533 /LENGTH=132 /DNA_ID=CAMNT_0042780775 /DNA_START=103 /DNA_END=501 /DNA_ORIENTATION=-
MSTTRHSNVLRFGKEVMPGQSQGSIPLDVALERTGWPHYKGKTTKTPLQEVSSELEAQAVPTQPDVTSTISNPQSGEEAVLKATMQCLENALDAVEAALENSNSPQAAASLIAPMSRFAVRLDAARRRLEEV